MEWHYALLGVAHGPVSISELVNLAAVGEITPEDWVWRQDLENWIPAAQVQELSFHKLTSDTVATEIPFLSRLEVSGADLKRAFQLVSRTKDVGRKLVSIEFHGGRAIIGLEEARTSIPAVGNWPGTAKVSRAFVRKMGAFDLDKIPMIPIACFRNRIMIGDRSHECQWFGP